jgi:hypothetical protein
MSRYFDSYINDEGEHDVVFENYHPLNGPTNHHLQDDILSSTLHLSLLPNSHTMSTPVSTVTTTVGSLSSTSFLSIQSSTLLPSTHRQQQQQQQQQLPMVKITSQRWIQLLYLSLLALLSDWVCFSLAAAPEVFESYYDGYSYANIIDLFLFVNVASCFLVTDVVAYLGMKTSIRMAAFLMCIGCWFRSGWNGLDKIIMTMVRIPNYNTQTKQEDTTITLEPLENVILGTIFVALAQPFVQCTPPLLSAQWFPPQERATATAIALNFNQVGIATAFWVAGWWGNDIVGLSRYSTLLAILSTLLWIGTMIQYQDQPEWAPSVSEWHKRCKRRPDPPFRRSVRYLFQTPGFTLPLAAFVCSIAVTNVIGVSTFS